MKKNPIISLYMVTHKDVTYIPEDRKPIFVGMGENNQRFLRDNKGDNISSKNKNYCELTALYWIWKNDTESDYVSIEHYRRFFMNKFKPISMEKIKEILKNYDGIITRKYRFKTSIKKYYAQNHIEADLNAVENAIKKKSPDYLKYYELIMNGNISSMCNMVLLSKKDFDTYCKWLFDILFDVEKNIEIENRDDYQQRVFGFLSERLLNVWILKNNLKMKELPLYYYDGNKVKSIFKSLKHLI